jgi:hypothetical protein
MSSRVCTSGCRGTMVVLMVVVVAAAMVVVVVMMEVGCMCVFECDECVCLVIRESLFFGRTELLN